MSPPLRSMPLRSFSMSGFKSGRSCRFRKPLPINLRRNLRGFDLAASAPENIGVGNRNAARLKMSIYRRFVIEQALFVRAMRNRHDVHVLKFRTGFAPVAMRQNVMTADFAAGLNFATLRHGPMKERIETRDADPALRRFDVFEECRKAYNDFE